MKDEFEILAAKLLPVVQLTADDDEALTAEQVKSWQQALVQALWVCHHAGTAVEEGRPVRTTLVITLEQAPPGKILRWLDDATSGPTRSDPGWFATTQREITKVGLAALPGSTALWVRLGIPANLRLIGVGDVPEPVRGPSRVIVELLAPGVMRLESMHGTYLYQRGHRQEYKGGVGEAIRSRLGPWLGACHQKLTARADEKLGLMGTMEPSTTERVASEIALRFVTTLCEQIARMAHGGTIVLLSEEISGRTKELFSRLKELDGGDEWSGCIADCIQVELEANPLSRDDDEDGSEDATIRASVAAARDAVHRRARMTACLGSVDGMLVLGPALEVVSFSAMVREAKPSSTRGAAAALGRGARHGSGIRLAEQLSEHAMVIILSQDGGITICRRLTGDEEGRLGEKLDIWPELADPALQQK